MNSPETHLAVAEAAQQRPCKQCGVPFTPRRSWAEFCSIKGNKCRNDWHRAMRPEAVREARELVRLGLEGCDPLVWNPRARKLLGIK